MCKSPSDVAGPAKVRPAVGVEYVHIIPKKLSFCTVRHTGHAEQLIETHPEMFFFSSHDPVKYVPFAMDFGPVDLSVVHEFCIYFREFYYHPRLIKSKRVLVFYCPDTMEAATNAAFLIGCFLVIELRWRPEDAFRPFSAALLSDLLGTFRDATESRKDYGLSVLSCLKGLHRAIQLKLYSPTTFDVSDYTQLADPFGTNMHFITPKLAAFVGPTQGYPESGESELPPGPKAFVETLKRKNVSAVVRLNASHYDKAKLTQEGFRHYDLYFKDCTTPSSLIMQEFIDIVDREPSAVAVHCQAGLGRTGTLIAVYIMKYLGFEAAEAIAWLRIVRPGSVLGPQQSFLHRVERMLLGNKLPGNRLLPIGSGSTGCSLSRCSSTSSSSPSFNSSFRRTPSTFESDTSERMGEVLAKAQLLRAAAIVRMGAPLPNGAGKQRPAERPMPEPLFKLPEVRGPKSHPRPVSLAPGSAKTLTGSTKKRREPRGRL